MVRATTHNIWIFLTEFLPSLIFEKPENNKGLHGPNEMCIGKWSCRASVFLPSSDLSLKNLHLSKKVTFYFIERKRKHLKKNILPRFEPSLLTPIYPTLLGAFVRCYPTAFPFLVTENIALQLLPTMSYYMLLLRTFICKYTVDEAI